jgi:hypothetical protein
MEASSRLELGAEAELFVYKNFFLKKSVVCFFSFLQKLRRKAYQGMQLLSVLITKELLHSNECGCLNCAVVN